MKRYLAGLFFAVATFCGTSHECGAQTVEVRDGAGKPMGGALVSLWQAGRDALEETTDTAGHFTFPAGWGQSVQVAVHGPGYAVWWHSYMTPPAQIAVQLKKGAALEGSVQYPDGAPAAGVRVRLYYSMPRAFDDDSSGAEADDTRLPFAVFVMPRLRESLAAVTDANGHYVLPDVPDRQDIVVALADERFVAEIAPAVSGDGIPVPTLTARPGASISGRVVDAAGQPVAGAKLSTSGGTERISISMATSGADGRYTLSSLPPGECTIGVQPHAAGIALTVTKATAKQGETTQAPDVKLEAGATLDILVRDAVTKAPIPNVSLQVNDTQTVNVWTASGFTDDQGLYHAKVAPGPVRVYPWPKDGYLDSSASEDRNRSVTVPPGGTKQLTIEMTKAVQVAGIAVDEKGAPVPNVVLRLGGEYDAVSAWTDAAGHFRFKNVAPATARPTVLPTAHGVWEVAMPPSVVVKSESLENQRWLLKPVATVALRGRVLDESGHPVEGVHVTLALRQKEYGQTRFRSSVTDAAGRYTLDAVLPSWLINVQSAGKAGTQMTRAGKARPPAKRVGLNGVEAVMADTPLEMEDTVVAHIATRSGRIVDEAGNPVAGATVLSPQNYDETEMRSDANGRFTLKAVSPGAARILAANATSWADVTSLAAEPGDITLHPMPRNPLSKDEARAMLDEQWKSGGRMAPLIPAALARFDVDMGLTLLKTPPNEKVGKSAQIYLVSYLAKRNAPALAAHPELLANLSLEGWQGQEAAFTLAEIAPAEARKFYDGLKEPPGSVSAAALATRLKTADAAARMDAAIAALRVSKETEQWFWIDNASTAAKGSAAFARRVTEAAPEKLRTAMRGWAMNALADHDRDGAMALLEELQPRPQAKNEQSVQEDTEDLGPEGSAWARGQAMQILIRQLARGDDAERAHALALARTIEVKNTFYPSAQALAAAALEAKDPAGALKLWREAYDNPGQRWGVDSTSIRLAALIRSRDEAQGAPLFAATRTALKGKWLSYPAQQQDEKLGQAVNLAALWGFYAGFYEPASSRIELENLWARTAPPPPADPLAIPDERQMTMLGQARMSIPRAMAEIDAKRAVEMARTLPDETARSQSLTLMALRALLPERQQRTAAYSMFQGSDMGWLDGDFWWNE